MPQIPRPPEREREPEPKTKKPKLSSAEIVRRVNEGRAQGRKIKEIMAEMGLSETAIYQHRKKVEAEHMRAALTKATMKANAVRTALPKPKLKREALPSGTITPAQRDEMRRRKAAGESIAHIAQSMGFKIGTVGPIIYKKPKPGTEAAA